MRIAQIKNGTVANIIIADDSYHLGDCDVVSEIANIGDRFDGELFAAPSHERISKNDALNYARSICDAKITQAYSHNGANRRQSLYGYLAYLSALSAADKMTGDQKSDLAVLVSAAEWEEKMIAAIPKIAAILDMSEIIAADWPVLKSDVADKLSALAAVS